MFNSSLSLGHPLWTSLPRRSFLRRQDLPHASGSLASSLIFNACHDLTGATTPVGSENVLP